MGTLLDAPCADPGVIDLNHLRQQQWDTADRRRTGPRLHEGVDVGQFLIGHHCHGVGRHLSPWGAHIRDEPLKRDGIGAESWPCRAPLRFVVVALIAGVSREERLALFRIATRGRRRLSWRWRGRLTRDTASRRCHPERGRDRGDRDMSRWYHLLGPQRTCVTTSTSAGSPRL